MERQEVTSSQIKSIGFDEETNTMEVEFLRNGAVYQYFDVPEEVFNDLVSADSVGKQFNQTIRDVFEYTRVS